MKSSVNGKSVATFRQPCCATGIAMRCPGRTRGLVHATALVRSRASSEFVDVVRERVDLAEQLVEFDVEVEVSDVDADSGGGQNVGCAVMGAVGVDEGGVGQVGRGRVGQGLVEVLRIAVAGVEAVFELADEAAAAIDPAAQVRLDVQYSPVVEVKCRVSTRGEVEFVQAERPPNGGADELLEHVGHSDGEPWGCVLSWAELGLGAEKNEPGEIDRRPVVLVEPSPSDYR